MRVSRALEIALVLTLAAFGVYQGFEHTGRQTAPAEPAVVRGQPAPPELQQFIARAIAVYRTGDYAQVLTVLPPREVEILQPRGQKLSNADLGKILSMQPGADASLALNLQELQAVQHEKPILEDDGARAVYPLAAPIQGQVQVVFVKIGGRWYKP